MKYKSFAFIICIGIFLTCILQTVNASTYVWNSNSTINASIPTGYNYAKPSVFYKDSSWYLITGRDSGTFYGFTWNGTNWIANSTIINALPNLGTHNSPSVFQKDGTFYLIVGENTGNFFGFAWNGTQWLPNSTINSSLPDVGDTSHPYVFYKDSSWYLLSGEAVGDFYGFAYNGTNWLPNSTINSSLPDIGYSSTPSVFQKDGTWYMLSGNVDGKFYGYAWNGTTWRVNTTINSSLPSVGDYSHPSVFYKDSSWYLLAVAGTGGTFYGFTWDVDITPPTYSQVSINQTYAGQVTNFAININDNGALNPNGQYIFSTNNTGVWVNDSAVNFTSTPYSANVTKKLNFMKGIGYKWYIQDNSGNTNSTPVYVFTDGDYYGWNINLTVNASLSSMSAKSSPAIFYKDSSWYLISGDNNGNFAGYTWNGANWVSNSTIITALPDLGFQSSPTVFQIGSNWYLISGENTGVFYGYAWNGTQWNANLTINASLVDIGTRSTPYVFYKDSSWYLISGEMSGTFFGYVWNGANWVSNSTIITALPDLGSYSAPSVFQKDGNWYLISGEGGSGGANDGKFFGYIWTGSSWTTSLTINSSLPDIGDTSDPTVFYKDSSWYLVSGAEDGKFYGYTWDIDATPPTYSQMSVNQTYSGDITNFAISVNDDRALNPNGQYIFSTNNTGVWVNDSIINFTSTYSWANSTRILNSTRGTTIGYRWYFSDNLGNTNSTPIYVLTTINYNTWVVNTTINASLPVGGTYVHPTVFYKDSSWYMIAGLANGHFSGYAWNGTDWKVNTTINSSLPIIGSNVKPTVFYKDSSWYLLSGENLGSFYGYAWNGTDWLVNLTINSSLGDIGSFSSPSVFYKDSSWYLLAGANAANNRFNGYVWNGTDWKVNATINASLPLVPGMYTAPSVFYKDSSWYLIYGDINGAFNGYAWNGTDWKVNTTINASLPNLGNYSTPFIFHKDSSWYIISGENGGLFAGYTYYVQRNSPPSIISLSYTPNSTGETDPGVVINITVNISDTDNNFNYSIIQWKNSTSNLWTNATMTNISVNGFYTILNGTFMLPSYEDNITFRVIAYDTWGEYSFSNNYSIQNFWDCTWSVSPSSLDEVVGFYEDKLIGNITLINTGDSAYSSNNCSIIFTIGYTGFSSTYTSLLADSSNWVTGNRAFQYASPIIVNASSNQTFSVNASFPSTTSSFTEVPSITITSSINDSVTNQKTTQILSTLLIAPPNPLLYQKISSYPSTYVFLTPGNFSLEAYVRNLGYDSSNVANTTAYNVSFNWTLPSDISSRISDGNETNFYEKLDTSSKQYNNLTINLTSENLASMPKGKYGITIYSYGYENKSENLSLIENSGNQILLNETIQVEFLCYDTIDGICVSSCGIGVDPDCVAPQTTTPPSTSSGGGGGSAPLKALAVATSADFQLVRGKQNEVKIIFENKDTNKSLTDLTFSVTGDIAKYIDINPKILSELGAKENTTIILTITSPTYIDLGKQELIVTMKAKKGQYDYTDSKNITLEIHELSIGNASTMLNESKDLINQLNEANLSSDSLNLLLNQSESALNTFDLEVVRDNYNTIDTQVKYALDSQNMIMQLGNSIKSAQEKGIDVSQSSRLLELAQLSIERGEYEQAYKRVKDAQLTYALEVKGELGKLMYYIKSYPKQISFGVLLLIILSSGVYNINKLRAIKKRIKKLKSEEEILNELIRVVQNECFKEKKISMSEYENAIKEYNKKISGITEELIELETKRTQMLRFTSKTKRLNLEREKIVSLIKELQEDYMKKKKFETRTYGFKIDSFNKRLAEIEEKLATVEAKKAVRGIGISLKIPKGE